MNSLSRKIVGILFCIVIVILFFTAIFSRTPTAINVRVGGELNIRYEDKWGDDWEDSRHKGIAESIVRVRGVKPAPGSRPNAEKFVLSVFDYTRDKHREIPISNILEMTDRTTGYVVSTDEEISKALGIVENE